MKNKNLIMLVQAFLAGLFIGIAGTIYLTIDNKIIGSIFFSFGLFVIVCNGYMLYTGKVGYLVTKNYSIKDILLIIIGNLIGTLFVALLIRLSNYQTLIDKVNLMLKSKMSHSYIELLVLGFFCGILMHIAVDGFMKIKNEVAKTFIVVFAVSIFILCGFEHSIADMFYIFLGGKITFPLILKLLIILIGNGLGASLLSFSEKMIKVNNELLNNK